MMEPALSVPPPLATLPDRATPFSQQQRARHLQRWQETADNAAREEGDVRIASVDVPSAVAVADNPLETETGVAGYPFDLGNAQDVSIGGVSVSSQGSDEVGVLDDGGGLAHRRLPPRPMPPGDAADAQDAYPWGDRLQELPPQQHLPSAPTPSLSVTRLLPPSPVSNASPPRSPSLPTSPEQTRIHEDPASETNHPYAAATARPAAMAATAMTTENATPLAAPGRPPSKFSALLTPPVWRGSASSVPHRGDAEVETDDSTGDEKGEQEETWARNEDARSSDRKLPRQRRRQLPPHSTDGKTRSGERLQQQQGQRIKELVRDKEKAESALSDLQSLFEGLTKDYGVVSRDAERARTELSSLHAHTAGVEEELGLLKTRAAAQAQKIAQFHDEWHAKTAHLRKQHDTLLEERDALQKQRNDLLDGHRTLRLQVESLQQSLADAKEGFDRKCRAQAKEVEERIRASYQEKENLLRLREQDMERDARRIEDGMHTVASENSSVKESVEQLKWRLKEQEKIVEKKDLLRAQLERSMEQARAQLAEAERNAEHERQQHAQRQRDVETSWHVQMQELKRLYETTASDKAALEKELRAQQKRHESELALREESRKDQWDRAADGEWALRTEIRKLKEQLSKAMDSHALEAAARQRIAREFEHLTDTTRPLQERLELTQRDLVEKTAKLASADTKLKITLVRLGEKEKEAETYRTALERALWVEQIEDAASNRDALLAIKWAGGGGDRREGSPSPPAVARNQLEKTTTARTTDATAAAGAEGDEEREENDQHASRTALKAASAQTPSRRPPLARHVETIERTTNAKEHQRQQPPRSQRSLPQEALAADEIFFDDQEERKARDAHHQSVSLRSPLTSPARPPRSPSTFAAPKGGSPWSAAAMVTTSSPFRSAPQHPYDASRPATFDLSGHGGISLPFHRYSSGSVAAAAAAAPLFGSPYHTNAAASTASPPQRQSHSVPTDGGNGRLRYALGRSSSPLLATGREEPRPAQLRYESLPQQHQQQQPQRQPQYPSDLSSILPLSFTSPPPLHKSDLSEAAGPQWRSRQPAEQDEDGCSITTDATDPAEERMIRKAVREVLRRQQHPQPTPQIHHQVNLPANGRNRPYPNNNNNVSVSTVSTAADSAFLHLSRAQRPFSAQDKQQPPPPQQQQQQRSVLPGPFDNGPTPSAAASASQGLFHSVNTSWQSQDSQAPASSARAAAMAPQNMPPPQEGSFIGLKGRGVPPPQRNETAEDPMQSVLDSYAQTRAESELRVKSTLDELADRQQRLLASVERKDEEETGENTDNDFGRAITAINATDREGEAGILGRHKTVEESSPQPRATAMTTASLPLPSLDGADPSEHEQKGYSSMRRSSEELRDAALGRRLDREFSTERAAGYGGNALNVAALQERFSSSF